MKRVLLLKIALLCLVLLVIGCRMAPVSRQHGRHKKVLIGFAMDTLKEERWQRDRDYFTKRLSELGADVIVENANNDTITQIAQINVLIDQGVDVLVIVPHEALKITTAVERAKAAGIKVVSYDRLIRNAPLDLYVSFDNIKVGELMAAYLVTKVPNGDYVIINGAPTDNNCSMFNQGYKNILNKPNIKPNIHIVYENWAEDWRPEAAYKMIETLLSKKQHFDAVIAANDSLAGAVIELLSEQRLAGKIHVVGHDADLSGCQRIVEGTQDMTVYKPIPKLAIKSADLVFALAKGLLVKPNRHIFNGKYYIPSVIIDPIPIDKNNISLIIKDGFHRMEDVYIHLPQKSWPKIN